MDRRNKEKKRSGGLDDALERISELERLENSCRRNEEEITRQHEFLTNVLESLPHPFYVLDARDYSIKMSNSAARFGELTPNSTCYSLTHRRSTPCCGDEHTCPLQVVKKTKKPYSVEHLHYDRDGRARNVEVHAYPIFDDKGEVIQMIEYSLDITERKKMEGELHNYAEKIKLFAYSVSHDLKNPLIGINGLVNLLHRKYRDRLDEKGKKYCDQILKSTEQVLALIDDINVYIKTKETPLHFEKIDPGKILEDVRDEFSAALADRRVSLSISEDIPEIKADRLSFFRLFRNLIDNSLKYGGEKMSEIKVEYKESEDFHTFSVADNGVGFPGEGDDKIFELFQRGPTARGKEGTGLGLGIVSEIAAKHQGRAWSCPGPEEGAAICLTLSKKL